MSQRGRLPDWIVIGTMKAATSSLHRYLAEHPQIATSDPKELDYFIEPRYSELGEHWYRQQFGEPSDALVAGESSVNYSKVHEFPGVANRMRELVPGVRLIYILRDPIKRIESQWIHSVGAGEWRGGFSSAVSELETSLPVQTSRYWTQLSQYLELFPTSQIKIMSFEAFSANPASAMQDVLQFLGLDPTWSHPLIGKRIHESRRKMRPTRVGLLFWEDQVRRRRLRKYLPYIAATPIKPPKWTLELRGAVEEYLRPEVEKIRDFSGLDFSEWSI